MGLLFVFPLFKIIKLMLMQRLFIGMIALGRVASQNSGCLLPDQDAFQQILVTNNVTQPAKVGFGHWIQFLSVYGRQLHASRPRRIVENELITGAAITGQQIIMIKSLVSSEILLNLQLALPLGDTQATFHLTYKNTNNQTLTLSFGPGINKFDGVWFYFNIQFDLLSSSSAFYFIGMQNSNDIFGTQIQLFNKGLAAARVGLQQFTIGGEGSFAVGIRAVNAMAFYGRLGRLLLPHETNGGFVMNFQQFQAMLNQMNCVACNTYCSSEVISLPVENAVRLDGEIEYHQELFFHGTSFYLKMWVKLNPLQIKRSSSLLLLRLASNFHYSDNSTLGDRLALISYMMYYPWRSLSYVSLSTLGYTRLEIDGAAPLKYDEKRLSLYGNGYSLLDSWQHITLSYASLKMRVLVQAQGLFEYLIVDQAIMQPNNSPIRLFLGADDFYAQAKFIGTIQNVEFRSCVFGPPPVNKYCHPTCQPDSCSGPGQEECLSCAYGRYFEQSALVRAGKCTCPFPQYEVPGSLQCGCKYFDYPEFSNIISVLSFRYVTDPGVQAAPSTIFGGLVLACPELSILRESDTQFMAISCIDCWLNQGWLENPICTLDYQAYRQVEEGNEIISFSLNHRPDTKATFYLIEEGSLQQCQGCLRKCTAEDESCSESTFKQLGEYVRIKCKPNYYLLSDACVPCGQFCIECAPTGECLQCEGPFYYSKQSDQCLECPALCEKCQLDQYAGRPFCTQCLKNYTLHMNSCFKCGRNCKKCERVFNSDIQEWLNRCLECEEGGSDTNILSRYFSQKYFIALDGENCAENTVQNCEIGFQFNTLNHNQNTLLLNFSPLFESSIIKTGCAKCKVNLTYTLETNRCENLNVLDHSFRYNQQSEVIKLISTISSKDQLSKCMTLDPKCVQCYELVYKKSSICAFCESGYYVGRADGECHACSLSNCEVCYEQDSRRHDSYVYFTRPFFERFLNSQGHLPFEIHGQNQDFAALELICLTCKEGYERLDGKCFESCRSRNCECGYINSVYQCVRCINSVELGGQSPFKYFLTAERCIKCPAGCRVCQSKSREEIRAVNPYFQVDLYDYFSNACLQLEEGKQLIWDSELKQLLLCREQTCLNTLVISMEVYCSATWFWYDFDNTPIEKQNEFLQQNILLATLFSSEAGSHLKNFENQATYLQANQLQIKNVQLSLSLKNSHNQTCRLNGTPFLSQEFSQNIYSAINVTLYLDGKGSQIEVEESIGIYNFTGVSIKNIQFEFLSPSTSVFIITSLQYQSINLFGVSFQTRDFGELTFVADSLKQFSINNATICRVKLINKRAFFLFSKWLLLAVSFNNLSVLDVSLENSTIIAFSEQVAPFPDISLSNLSIRQTRFRNSAALLIQQETSLLSNLHMDQLTIIDCQSLLQFQSKFNFLHNITIQNSVIYASKIAQISRSTEFAGLELNFLSVFSSNLFYINLKDPTQLIVSFISILLENVQLSLDSNVITAEAPQPGQTSEVQINSLFVYNSKYVNPDAQDILERPLLTIAATQVILQKIVLQRLCQAVGVDSARNEFEFRNILRLTIEDMAFSQPKCEISRQSQTGRTRQSALEFFQVQSIEARRLTISDWRVQDSYFLRVSYMNPYFMETENQLILENFLIKGVHFISSTSETGFLQIRTAGTTQVLISGIWAENNQLYSDGNSKSQALNFISTHAFNSTVILSNLTFIQNRLIRPVHSLLSLQVSQVTIEKLKIKNEGEVLSEPEVGCCDLTSQSVIIRDLKLEGINPADVGCIRLHFSSPLSNLLIEEFFVNRLSSGGACLQITKTNELQIKMQHCVFSELSFSRDGIIFIGGDNHASMVQLENITLSGVTAQIGTLIRNFGVFQSQTNKLRAIELQIYRFEGKGNNLIDGARNLAAEETDTRNLGSLLFLNDFNVEISNFEVRSIYEEGFIIMNRGSLLLQNGILHLVHLKQPLISATNQIRTTTSFTRFANLYIKQVWNHHQREQPMVPGVQSAALIQLTGFDVKMDSVVIEDISLQNGSIIEIELQSEQSTYLSQSILRNCSVCEPNGCIDIFSEKGGTVRVFGYFCLMNIAKAGPCLHSRTEILEIRNSIFVANMALYQGGALYIKSQSSTRFDNIQFINNSAQYATSLVLEQPDDNSYWYQSSFFTNSMDQHLVSENTISLALSVNKDNALLTSVEASLTGIRVRMVSQSILLPLGVQLAAFERFNIQTKSFENANLSFRVFPVNSINQTQQLSSNFICQIWFAVDKPTLVPSEMTYITNSTYIPQQEGFNFDFLKLDTTLVQKEFHKLYIIAHAFQTHSLEDKYNRPYLIIPFQLFPCQLGEVQSSYGVCEACNTQEGYYSLEQRAARCLLKDELSMRSVGKGKIELKKHFWRPFFSSSQGSFCRYSFDNCEGGYQFGDASCSRGYMGALCEECDKLGVRGEGRQYKQTNGKCQSCQDQGSNLTHLFFVVAWIVTLGVSCSCNITQQIDSPLITSQIRSFLAAEQSFFSILIKLAQFNFFSIFMLYTLSKFRASEDLQLLAMYAAEGHIRLMSILISCFDEAAPSNYQKLRVYLSVLTMPLLLVLLSIAIIYRWHKFRMLKWFQLRILFISLIVYHMLYTPAIIYYHTVSLMWFRSISGEYWLLQDVSILFEEIFNQKLLLYALGCASAIITLIVPMIIYILLTVLRTNARHKYLRRQVRILFIEYKPEFYYWEIVVYYYKICMIVIVTIFHDEVYIRAVVLCMFSGVYRYLVEIKQPFLIFECQKLTISIIEVYQISVLLELATSIYQIQQEQEGLLNLFKGLLLLLNIYIVVILSIQILSRKLNIKLSGVLSKCMSLQCMKNFKFLKSNLTAIALQRKRAKNNFKRIVKKIILQEVLEETAILRPLHRCSFYSLRKSRISTKRESQNVSLFF